MRLFGRLYDRVLSWSGHPRAVWYLGGLSFAESSFFPVPPDVLLVPMALARRERTFFYALVTSVASVLGGIAGYLLGYYALETTSVILERLGYWDPEGYETIRAWFEEWGFLTVFLAGFSPIPYKLFTIGAGAVSMSLPLFVLASAVSRSARFFLVAGLTYWGGHRIEPKLKPYIDTIGWSVVGLLVVAFLLW